jgi:hypothetical protein
VVTRVGAGAPGAVSLTTPVSMSQSRQLLAPVALEPDRPPQRAGNMEISLRPLLASPLPLVVLAPSKPNAEMSTKRKKSHGLFSNLVVGSLSLGFSSYLDSIALSIPPSFFFAKRSVFVQVYYKYTCSSLSNSGHSFTFDSLVFPHTILARSAVL